MSIDAQERPRPVGSAERSLPPCVVTLANSIFQSLQNDMIEGIAGPAQLMPSSRLLGERHPLNIYD